ncbi:MAG: hypothetical protein ACP5NF_01235 [Thermoanaerobaculum sp.]
MRGLAIFALLLGLVTPQLESLPAFPKCPEASCCCGGAPSCPCTARPQEPEPSEPTAATVALPAPHAALPRQGREALASEPFVPYPSAQDPRLAPALYIVTHTFRC